MFNRIYKKTLLKKVISVFMVAFICTNLFIIKPKKADAFVAEAIGLGLTFQTILDFATVAIGAGCILNNMDELVYMGKTMYKNFSKLFVRDKATGTLTVPKDVVPAVNKFVATYDYSSDSYLAGKPTIVQDSTVPSFSTYQSMIKSIDINQNVLVPDTLSINIDISIPQNHFYRKYVLPIGDVTFKDMNAYSFYTVSKISGNLIRDSYRIPSSRKLTLYLEYLSDSRVRLCFGTVTKNSSGYVGKVYAAPIYEYDSTVAGNDYSFSFHIEKDSIDTFLGSKYQSVTMNSVLNYNSSVSLPLGNDIIINTNGICADGSLYESPDNIYDLPIEFPLTNESIGNGVITVPGDVVVPPADVVVPPGDVVVPGENTGLIGEIAQGVRSIADSIVDGFSGVLDGMSSFADSVVDTVSDIFVPPVDSTSEIDFSPLYISLQNKFPFSLPFDFINIIKDFNSEVHEPIFYVNMNAFNYKNNSRSDVGFYIDFTEFEKLFKIVRYFILISFIVFIIFVTRKIIGG